MLKNHLKSDNTRINNNFVQILTSLIKFILDCNTLTGLRLETSSSNRVHCSNEQKWCRSSWGSDDSKWLLLGALRMESRLYRGFLAALGRRRYSKLPGAVTKLRFFPPNSLPLWGIRATTRFSARGGGRGRGRLLPATPPRALQLHVHLKRARGRCFQTMTFK